MRPWRFIVPVLPVLAFAVQDLGERLSRSQTGRRVGGIILIAYLISWWISTPPDLAYVEGYRQGMEHTVIPLGRQLRQTAPPGAWIATGDIGALPYYSGLRVLDLYGLVNPEVARMQGPALHPEYANVTEQLVERQAAAILEQRPEFLMLSSSQACGSAETFRGSKLMDDAIGRHPIRRQEYVLEECMQFSHSETSWVFRKKE